MNAEKNAKKGRKVGIKKEKELMKRDMNDTELKDALEAGNMKYLTIN